LSKFYFILFLFKFYEFIYFLLLIILSLFVFLMDLPSESSDRLAQHSQGVLKYGRLVGLLKSQRRAGWGLCGVGAVDGECIAAHMYRMALLAFLAAEPDELFVDEKQTETNQIKSSDDLDPNVQDNKDKCIEEMPPTPSPTQPHKRHRLDISHVIALSLVHDLCEAIAGDITPHDGVSDKDKHTLEAEAMEQISTLLRTEVGLPSVGRRLTKLWEEYEANATPEAKFVKDLDKFDMVLQAAQYEETFPNLNFDTFFETTKGVFQSTQVRAWDTALRSERNKLKSNESK
jgi:5'-deoxynucleotidase YfbR-like HD superfamily hydrolase